MTQRQRKVIALNGSPQRYRGKVLIVWAVITLNTRTFRLICPINSVGVLVEKINCISRLTIYKQQKQPRDAITYTLFIGSLRTSSSRSASARLMSCKLWEIQRISFNEWMEILHIKNMYQDSLAVYGYLCSRLSISGASAIVLRCSSL